MPAGGEENLGS